MKRNEKYGSGEPRIVVQRKPLDGLLAIVLLKTPKKLYEKLKHLDAVFYVDDWDDPYKQIFPKNKLVIGKKHTTLIESNNSNIRHFLTGMTRRTKVVSRSVEMVDLTLRLCWNINENDFFKIFQNKFLGLFS